MAKSSSRQLRGYVSGIGNALEGKPKWRSKPATFAAVILLFLIALGQLLRLVFQVKVIANGIAIPLWGSAIACVVAVILTVMLGEKAGFECRGGGLPWSMNSSGYSSSKPSVFI